jgi:distribution and morphology protein 10
MREVRETVLPLLDPAKTPFADYLMYGRLYIPTGRLDALYATRLTPTLQMLIAAISDPPTQTLLSQVTQPRVSSNDGLSNIMVNLQHDVGNWCTEYTWSAGDSMFGLRVLHNFGLSRRLALDARSPRTPRPKRVDEEEVMGGGLKGRFSAGGELYFSAKEKSLGVSTAIRFTTVPDAAPPSTSETPQTQHVYSPSQPPTTLTAVFNPMMGHISTAYATRVSRDLSVCSRFDFNFYSYLSEWTLGAELWIGGKSPNEMPSNDNEAGARSNQQPSGVVKAKVSTNAVSVTHNNFSGLFTDCR